jgi:hypothetical protein
MYSPASTAIRWRPTGSLAPSRNVTDAGLPPIRLHDLRHGAATLALAAGVDLRTVQEQLGHSSIVLTADTYTSVLPDVARIAAEKVATLIIRAGCLVPGTHRRRRRQTTRRRRKRGRPRPAGRSRAHAGRQIGRPRRRTVPGRADLPVIKRRHRPDGHLPQVGSKGS